MAVIYYKDICYEQLTGHGAVWLAHLLWEQGVAGSNPAAPTNMNNKIRGKKNAESFSKAV